MRMCLALLPRTGFARGCVCVRFREHGRLASARCIFTAGLAKTTRSRTMLIETESIMLIERAISPHLRFHRFWEGTRADFAIRPNCLPAASPWLPVQLKSSKQQRPSFLRVAGYTGMPILFHAMRGPHLWLFDGASVGHLSGLRITPGGKWDNEGVRCGLSVADPGFLGRRLVEAYRSRLFQVQPLIELATQVSRQARVAYENAMCADQLLRMAGMSWRRPAMHHTTVDRYVFFNGEELAVQEKTSYLKSSGRRGLAVNMWTNEYPGVRPYREGDFDVLIVHLPASHLYHGRLFYVIPAIALLSRGVMTSSRTGYPGLLGFIVYPPGSLTGPSRDEWANEFLVDMEASHAAIRRMELLFTMSCTHASPSSSGRLADGSLHI